MLAASQRRFNVGRKGAIQKGQSVSKSQRRVLILMAYGIGILADNGAYEDAAWLSADIGSFLETSEIYTKLNKHERALAGYARGKQFKRMFNYIRKFYSQISPAKF